MFLVYLDPMQMTIFSLFFSDINVWKKIHKTFPCGEKNIYSVKFKVSLISRRFNHWKLFVKGKTSIPTLDQRKSIAGLKSLHNLFFVVYRRSHIKICFCFFQYPRGWKFLTALVILLRGFLSEVVFSSSDVLIAGMILGYKWGRI